MAADKYVGFIAPDSLATTGGNTNPTLAHPGPANGDLVLAFVQMRPSSCTVATPSGWTKVAEEIDNSGEGEGVDLGTVRQYVFSKTADGTEGTTTQTWTKTGTISVWQGTMATCRSATGTYDVEAFTVQVPANSTAWSGVITSTDDKFAEGDLGITFASEVGDAASFNNAASSWNLNGTDMVYEVDTSSQWEYLDAASTTGNDSRIGLASFNMLAGSSNTGNVTASVSLSAARHGCFTVLRVRKGSGTDRTDVWQRSLGPMTAGGGSIACRYPAHRIGDLLVYAVTSRGTTDPTPSTPSGWTYLGTVTGGVGTYASDSGLSRTTLFYRVAAVEHTGTSTVTITGGGSCIAQIASFAAPDTATFRTPLFTGASYNSAVVGWSAACADSLAFLNGDVLFAVFSNNTDAQNSASAFTFSASGVTTANLHYNGYFETTTGNDSGRCMAQGRVTVGATATPTMGITWGLTAAANRPAGSGALLVIGANLVVDGTINSAWGDLVATASGTVTPGGGPTEIFGTVNSAWGGMAATASGTHEIPGTVNSAWGGVSATAVATRGTAGTAVGAFGGLTATAVGTHEVPAIATGSFGALVATAIGAVTTPATEWPGTISSAWGALAATASGTREVPATAAGVWGGMSATGVAVHEIPGVSNSNWGALTATATGTHEVAGAASGVFGALPATATGTVSTPAAEIFGTASGPFGTINAISVATVDHAGIIASLWGGWLATAVGSTSLGGTISTSWGGWFGTAVAIEPVVSRSNRMIIVGPPPIRRALSSVKVQLDDLRARIEALESP